MYVFRSLDLRATNATSGLVQLMRNGVVPKTAFSWHTLMKSVGRKKITNSKRVDFPQIRNSFTQSISNLEHMCQLQFNAPTPLTRLTSIACSIGPASQSVAKLEKMVENGMNIACLNCFYASHESNAEIVANLRQIVDRNSSKLGFRHEVSIALDIQGPEIRIGLIHSSEKGSVKLRKGSVLKLTTNKNLEDFGQQEIVYVDYAHIVDMVKAGHRIFLKGHPHRISLLVKDLQGDEIICEIENSGRLDSRNGVNLPGIDIDLPAVTEKDKVDLQFAVDQNLDMVFASFTRSAAAPNEIRSILGERGKHIKIISKIANHQGMQNLEEIIEASDGVLVARGNLGREMPLEKVFVAQKSIIARCNKAGKPVLCATQMLKSMIKNPRATRAEMSDAGNAVLDGVDCVMLSRETSIGQYPVKCVATMDRALREAESAIWHYAVFKDIAKSSTFDKIDEGHSVSIAAADAAIKSNAAAIVIICPGGKSARRVSWYRPPCPIIAFVCSSRLMRQLHLHRGIFPFLINFTYQEGINWLQCVDHMVAMAIKFGKSKYFIKTGDPLVLVSSWSPACESINAMRVIVAP